MTDLPSRGSYPDDWTPEMVAAAEEHNAFMDKASAIYFLHGQAAADRFVAEQLGDSDA